MSWSNDLSKFGTQSQPDFTQNFGLPQAGNGAGNGAIDWGSEMQKLLAAGDVQGAAQIRTMMTQEGFNAESLAAMKNMSQPPSKWATGTQMFGNVAQGLAGLGNIYLGLQGMKEQKKMNKFNMGVVNTNLGNSITDYNRRLNDTLSNRALNNGGGQSYISDQLSKYSAKRSG